ncbi:hypothetical protein LIER_16306 [Lithospermum erythrorhizon]|uniref:Uncharacterized protein n=1 Tax=Lithospermum erythrorhizon TaxID=34254 RepID=A0AAV3Q9D0_LITER
MDWLVPCEDPPTDHERCVCRQLENDGPYVTGLEKVDMYEAGSAGIGRAASVIPEEEAMSIGSEVKEENPADTEHT